MAATKATKKRAPKAKTAPLDITPAGLLAVVHQQAAAGEIAPHEAQRAAHALGADPAAVPVPCEAPGCVEIGPLGTRYSILLIYAVTGAHAGVPPYGCAREQHYGCTHDHAILAAQACLVSHLPHPASVYPSAAE